MVGKLTNDIIRGFGLKTGRTLASTLENQVKARTLNSNSKFRKLVTKFTLTGKFAKDVEKLISIINSFDEEYSTTKATFQKSFYLSEDVYFIDTKIEFLSEMCINEDESKQITRLDNLWRSYKTKHNG